MTTETTTERQLLDVIQGLLLTIKYNDAVLDGYYPSTHPAPDAQRDAVACLRNAGIRVKSIWPRSKGPNSVDFSYWEKDAAQYVREFNRRNKKSFGRISSSCFPNNPDGRRVYLDVYSMNHSGICGYPVPGDRITLADVKSFIECVTASRAENHE